jgi:hypothetical protein
MRLSPTTSLNDCIKRIAEGDTGAATVLALIVKEFPDSAIEWMHLMDKHELYGHKVWTSYRSCRQDIALFLESIKNGSIAFLKNK